MRLTIELKSANEYYFKRKILYDSIFAGGYFNYKSLLKFLHAYIAVNMRGLNSKSCNTAPYTLLQIFIF